MTELVTPYQDLLPPLSTQEREALEADIRSEGVLAPVLVTEDGVVLDGHNRLSVDNKAPTKIVAGSGDWSEAHRKAFVMGTATKHRNMSDSQWRGKYDKVRKSIAKALALEGYTQERIGQLFGVARNTVSVWLGISNVNDDDTNNPDCRVKIPPRGVGLKGYFSTVFPGKGIFETDFSGGSGDPYILIDFQILQKLPNWKVEIINELHPFLEDAKQAAN